MVEQPDFALRMTGWLGVYGRTALEGGTYHPACIWLASRVWVPRTLRVVKVGFKVSLEWPLGIGLILQDLAHLALWVRVQNKSRLRYRRISKVSLSVLRYSPKSTNNSHMPTNRTPPLQQQQSRLGICYS